MKQKIIFIIAVVLASLVWMGAAEAAPKHHYAPVKKSHKKAQPRMQVPKRATALVAVAAVAAVENSRQDDQEGEDDIQSTQRAASNIAKSLDVPETTAWKIVALARKYEDPVFPKYRDIIGIIAIESRFDPKARNANCLGLMQMNRFYHRDKVRAPKDFYNPEENIRAGVEYLKELHSSLKSRRAAIMAFNLGEGWYRSGKRNAKYVADVDKAARLYGI